MRGKDFAWEIVNKAFEDRTDLVGEPYIYHIKRVYEAVSNKNEEIQCIAILHDLLEDCPEWNEKVLRTFFYSSIVESVVALTKVKGENYEDYMARVAVDRYATIVKIADLKDNMNVSRLKELKEKDVQRLRKYISAYQYLTNH